MSELSISTYEQDGMFYGFVYTTDGQSKTFGPFITKPTIDEVLKAYFIDQELSMTGC